MSPSANFGVATPTSGVNGTVGFDFRRYEDDSDLDDNNARFDIKSFHDMERSRLGLDFRVTKDTTLDTQLEETGLVFDRVDRRRIDVGPNWSYFFGERTSVSANYRYSDLEYQNTDGTGFVDFSLHSAQASLIHVINEKTTASIVLSRTESENENDVESTNTGLQGGASFQFSETLSAFLFVGVRRTEVSFSRTSLVPEFSGTTITFTPVTSNMTNGEWGSTYSASITKAFSRGETTLSVSRDISNDTNGQPIEATRLSSTNLYRFNEILSAILNLEFSNNQSNNNFGSTLNRDYYQIEPKFEWRLKKSFILSGSYRYRTQTFDDIKDEATQNAAYLTLTYRWPKIAVSR